MRQDQKGTGQGDRPRLLPDRHPVRDFFIAEILDWALKGDRHSMEHPMFSLSKTPDRHIRHYEHNGISVTIAPSAYGLANIWDKDILLYCISVLMEGINQGREITVSHPMSDTIPIRVRPGVSASISIISTRFRRDFDAIFPVCFVTGWLQEC
jgi:hypothetical protein